jgi:hypothetical protein
VPRGGAQQRVSLTTDGRGHEFERGSELSAAGPTVPGMSTNETTPPLRVVRDDERSPADREREDYWARVQALRADLARLRSA